MGPTRDYLRHRPKTIDDYSVYSVYALLEVVFRESEGFAKRIGSLEARNIPLYRKGENRRMINGDHQAKKEWSQPVLSVYGTVEDITHGCDDKMHGKSDGIALKAPPIQCAS